MIDNLSPEQQKQLELAEKLFRTAGRSKDEAEVYVAKAMKILEDLNLDMSVLEQGGGEKTKRSDELLAGGRYKYQRDLWEAIADLHFCFYWNQRNWDKNKISPYHVKKHGMASAKQYTGGYVFQHRVVGRTVNVIGTRNMAQYLEMTIERLVRDHIGKEMRQDSTYAMSYRSGVAEEVIHKIYKRREEVLAEEKRKEHEAAERAAQAGMASVGSQALTIGSIAKSEQEANWDFLHGEGSFARMKARREESAKRMREAEAAHAKWAAENPEEARKQEEERRKEERRRESRYRAPRAERDNRDWSGYSAGRKAGKDVSIDPQAEGGKGKGLLS